VDLYDAITLKLNTLTTKCCSRTNEDVYRSKRNSANRKKLLLQATHYWSENYTLYHRESLYLYVHLKWLPVAPIGEGRHSPNLSYTQLTCVASAVASFTVFFATRRSEFII